MGADPSAFSVIGAKVSRDGFRRTVPAFDHVYPDDFQFCPKTGRALRTGNDDLDVARDEGENFRRSSVATHRLSDMATEVKASLAKVGIEVTEDAFGLWTVLYCG